MVHFKETQTGSFVFLSRILAPDTNLPAFFPQSSSQLFGPEMYPGVTKSTESSTEGTLPPSLFVLIARQVLH